MCWHLLDAVGTCWHCWHVGTTILLENLKNRAEKMHTTSPMVKITMATDFNKKLSCDCFLHIDLAPRSPLPEREVIQTIIEISTADNSHAPVLVKLLDVCRINLGEVFSLATFASHGMDFYDFYIF